jgi:hypothetical protein
MPKIMNMWTEHEKNIATNLAKKHKKGGRLNRRGILSDPDRKKIGRTDTQILGWIGYSLGKSKIKKHKKYSRAVTLEQPEVIEAPSISFCPHCGSDVRPFNMAAKSMQGIH